MFKGFNRLRVFSIVWKTVQNARGWREKWVVLLGYYRDCLKVRLVTQFILTYTCITNSWWYKWAEVFRCQRINHLIKEDEFVIFSLAWPLWFSLLDVRLSHPVSDKRDWIDACLVAPVTMRAASFFFLSCLPLAGYNCPIRHRHIQKEAL